MTKTEDWRNGPDGDLTADAWYRATLQAPADGRYTLQFHSARDRVQLFVDGARVATEGEGARPEISLTAGKHTLAVFTAHDGRDKLFNHIGPVDTIDAKGLSGPVALQQGDGPAQPVTGWKMQPASGEPGDTVAVATDGAPGWTEYTIGNDAFDRHRGGAWFQATLPASGASGGARNLHWESVDDDAVVYLNGKRVGEHSGWNQPFDVTLPDSAWNPATPNVVTVYVRNTDGTGGISKPVTLTAYRYTAPITGWRLRGGPGDPLAKTGWTALAPADRFDHPQFFRTTFTVAPLTDNGAHPIWRVVTTSWQSVHHNPRGRRRHWPGGTLHPRRCGR